jgi:hypothetical protein
MICEVRYFFDLPVYRLPESDYQEDLERFVQEQLDRAGGTSRDADIQFEIREHARKSFGGPWRYNEVIGYIRLHFFGSQVRGDYFAMQAKRTVKTRRKIYWKVSHKCAPEIAIPRDATTDAIFGVVHSYVDRCRQELRGRFIDDSDLLTLGKYIDWKGLYEST